MIKKTITFTDYDGEKRTQDFYFNLNKAELIELELNTVGGMKNYVDTIMNSNDRKAMVKLFKDFMLKSYGKKSADGVSFIKNEEQTRAFEQSEAYSELFMELVSNADSANAFFAGIVPAAVMDEIRKTPEYNSKMAEITG